MYMKIIFVALVWHVTPTLGSRSGSHISRCSGSYIRDVLCSDGTVIQVAKANFGILYHWKPCHIYEIDPESDYQFPVSNTYYQEIQECCNNKTKCEGLYAKRPSMDNGACGWQCQVFPVYVTIFYDCIPDSELESTTARATSTVTTTSHAPRSNASGRSQILGWVVGITCTGIFLAVMIGVVVCITKKKQNFVHDENCPTAGGIRGQIAPISGPRVTTVSDGDHIPARGMGMVADQRQNLSSGGPIASAPGSPPPYTSAMALEYSKAIKPVRNPLYSNLISNDNVIRISEIPDEDPPSYNHCESDTTRNGPVSGQENM